MRAAIYTRYSSENQRDTSIDDQLAANRAIANQLGAGVVAVYNDSAVSGTRRDRPDFLRMLNDARAGKFDILILWDLKRLSRGEDLPQLLAQLKFIGIRIITCDGFDSIQEGSKLRGWFDAIMGNQYLEDLARATHRGMTGQFNRGLFAGGMAYGYRSVEVAGGHALAIDEDEAEWVRWIFARYAEGKSPQAIAYDLNARGVPSPRGSTWAVSAIYGSPSKGCGILNNELYIGRYVWNRSKWMKNPDTGKRQRIERAQSEWMIDERPELRIVSQELWAAARARLARPAIDGGRGKGRPASSLLGGLLRCAHCGGTVIAINPRYYGCLNNKDRGPAVCQGVAAKRETVELRILSTLRDDLMSPASIAALQEEYRAAIRELTSAETSGRDEAAARLPALEREIRNLTDAVASAGWSKALGERLAQAEGEYARLRAIAQAPAPKRPELPDVLNGYRELLANLLGELKTNVTEARNAIRELLGEIRMVKEGQAVYVEFGVPADRLLLAAGGEVYKYGSGGPIPYLYQNRVRVR